MPLLFYNSGENTVRPHIPPTLKFDEYTDALCIVRNSEVTSYEEIDDVPKFIKVEYDRYNYRVSDHDGSSDYDCCNYGI